RTAVKIASYPAFIVIAVFIISFACQLSIWLSANYIDEKLWFDDAVKISHGNLPKLGSPTPVHPGTAILLPAALMMQLPGDPSFTYHVALCAHLAMGIACAAYTCYALRPQTLWWLCTFFLLAPNTMLPNATAPSALASVLAVLFVLLV